MKIVILRGGRERRRSPREAGAMAPAAVSSRERGVLAIEADGHWVLINMSPAVAHQLEVDERLGRHDGLPDAPVRALVLTDAQVDHVGGLLSLRDGAPINLYATPVVFEELTTSLPVLPVLQHYCGVHWHVVPVAGDRHVAQFQVEGLPSDSDWEVIALSLDQWRLLAAGAAIGGNVRVGLEDNFYLAPGQMARSNGDLVEKGGAAQQLRGLYFADGVNGTPSRPLYTCTQGPGYPVCNTNYSTSPSLLSATPFAVANTDITAGDLSIDSRIVQPLTVRETGDGRFQLIAGERRLRAARLAGLTHVPAYVRTADDTAMLEMALVENIQREDLDAIEVAITYQRLIEECSLTQEQLSDRVGKQRSTVANYLRLLRLPAEIQLGIRNRNMTMGHARTLVNIEDPKRQIDIFYHIINEDLSVRATEDLVRHVQAEASKDPARAEKKKKLNTEFDELAGQLSTLFSTPVQFRINEKGRGKIVIPFADGDEMERIISMLDKLNM